MLSKISEQVIVAPFLFTNSSSPVVSQFEMRNIFSPPICLNDRIAAWILSPSCDHYTENGMPHCAFFYLISTKNPFHCLFWPVSLVGMVMQICIKLTPPIGVYIAFLAFLGALVTIFPPKHPLIKAVWIIMFACIFWFEIDMLYEKERAYVRERTALNESFKEITDNLKENTFNLVWMLQETKDARKEERKQFTSLLKKQENLFNNQERLTQQSINTVTGGDSFGYIEAIKPWRSHSWLPRFKFKGKYPLYQVKAQIVDLNKFDSPNIKHYDDTQQAVDEWTKKHIHLDIGDIGADESISKIFNVPIQMGSELGHLYQIFFSAKNGLWIENLKIVNVNGKQLEAIQVYTPKKGGTVKSMFEQIDDGFPRNNRGEIDW